MNWEGCYINLLWGDIVMCVLLLNVIIKVKWGFLLLMRNMLDNVLFNFLMIGISFVYQNDGKDYI